MTRRSPPDTSHCLPGSIEYIKTQWPKTMPNTVESVSESAETQPALLVAEMTFQKRCLNWLLHCFGVEVTYDRVERNYRFLEEACELVQACDMTKEQAHAIVDYVYGRDVGEKPQETGGVMITLAALCIAQGIDMHICGEIELDRVWACSDRIREKQKSKPLKGNSHG